MTAVPRVLMWASSFRPRIGGVSVLVTNLVTALRAGGVPVAVLTDSWDSPPGCDTYDGVDVLRLPFLDALSGRDPRRILDLVQGARHFADRFRPDLVHLHGLGADTVLFDLLVRRMSRPLVMTRHEHFPDAPESLGTSRRILQSARCVVVPTQALAHDVRRVAPGIVEDRLQVVPNGIPGSGRDVPAASYEPLRFVFVGRLVPQKGVDIALRALARFQQRHGPARLRIIGEGPERAALQELARELGVEGVEFSGPLAPAWIQGAIVAGSVLLVPSRCGEGFGLVAAEAALARRCVIASRVAGLDEVVLDGITGLLVAPDSPVELEAAMHRLAHDRALASVLAETAYTRATQLYSMERCARAYHGIYEDVLKGTR